MGAPSRAYGPGPKTRGSCLSSQIRSGHVLIHVKNRHPSASLCTCFRGNCPRVAVSLVCLREDGSWESPTSPPVLSPALWSFSTRSCAGAPGNAPVLGHQEMLLALGNAPGLARQETPPTLQTLISLPAHPDFLKYTLMLAKRSNILLTELVKCRLNECYS